MRQKKCCISVSNSRLLSSLISPTSVPEGWGCLIQHCPGAPPPPGGGKKAQGQHFWLSHTFLVLRNCRAYKRWWKSKRQSSWCFWHFSRINYYLLNEWINRCWSFHLRRDLITSPYIQWLSAYMASKECKMKWFFSSSDPIFQSLHCLWLEWLLCCLQPVPTPLFGGPGSCIMDAQGHLTWPHYPHGQ